MASIECNKIDFSVKKTFIKNIGIFSFTFIVFNFKDKHNRKLFYKNISIGRSCENEIKYILFSLRAYRVYFSIIYKAFKF